MEDKEILLLGFKDAIDFLNNAFHEALGDEHPYPFGNYFSLGYGVSDKIVINFLNTPIYDTDRDLFDEEKDGDFATFLSTRIYNNLTIIYNVLHTFLTMDKWEFEGEDEEELQEDCGEDCDSC